MLKNVNNISISSKIFSKNEISESIIDFSSLVEGAFSGAEMVLPVYVSVNCDILNRGMIKGNQSLMATALFNLILNSIFV